MNVFQLSLTPVTFLLSIIYGLLILIRNKLYDWKWITSFAFDIPIISVGNITIGGSGKTPLVMYLADTLKKNGRKPAIVSRGYGRNSQGLVMVHDGKKLCSSVEMSGDEPYLMARLLKNIPIVVCENKGSAINELKDYYSANVIIMDDGFQHRKVRRDLDIITISANDKKNDYRLLPWGKLREPLQNIKRADAVVFTKTENYKPPHNYSMVQPLLQSKPFFCTQQMTLMQYDSSGYHKSLPPSEPLFAFCGIGEPDSFFKSIKQLNIKLGGKRSFPDHQEYTDAVINELSSQVHSSGCKGIITTEKDLVKLPDSFFNEFDTFVIKIEMEFENERTVLDMIQPVLWK